MDPKLLLHSFAGLLGAVMASGQLTPPGSPVWMPPIMMALGAALAGWAAHTYDPDHLALQSKLDLAVKIPDGGSKASPPSVTMPGVELK